MVDLFTDYKVEVVEKAVREAKSQVKPLPPITVVFSKWDMANEWPDKDSSLRQAFAATLAALDSLIPRGYGVMRVSCLDTEQVQGVFDTVVKVRASNLRAGVISTS